MSKRLPEYIDPVRLAENNRLIDGNIAMAKMKRLASSLTDSKGDVHVHLQFGVDDTSQANIVGEITAELHLQCQRCMQDMAQTVNCKVSLAMVHSEVQAEQLPGRYEPLILEDTIDSDVDGKAVSLTELVEDELILALPAIARHDISECPAGDKFRSASIDGDMRKQDQQEAPEKANPFAVLEQLKGKD